LWRQGQLAVPASGEFSNEHNSNREEVKFMTYEKPVIAVLADAAEAIQGSKLGGPFDSVNPTSTEYSIATYEADE